MASIGGGESGGKKRVDQELPLVPFIDLLFCCVMFLLATAVWSQAAEVPVASSAAPDGVEEPDPHAPPPLVLTISQHAYRLQSELGTDATIARSGEGAEAELDTQLGRYLELMGRASPVHLMPDDDVRTGDVVATMDAVRGAGFEAIQLPGTR